MSYASMRTCLAWAAAAPSPAASICRCFGISFKVELGPDDEDDTVSEVEVLPSVLPWAVIRNSSFSRPSGGSPPRESRLRKNKEEHSG